MRLRRLLPLSTLVLVATLVGCAPPPPEPVDTAADEAAVNDAASAWAAAFNAGNAEGVAGLYTEDAVFMRNHQPTLNGAGAIAAAMRDQMDAMETMITVSPAETTVLGDTAIGHGTYAMTLTPKAEGSAPVTDEGSYMVVMDRQADGTWKISRHIGNSSLPLPAPASMAP